MKREPDRIEKNNYGVVCVIGYRKVSRLGTVRIGGHTFGSPELVQHAGKFVFLEPYDWFGNYQARIPDEGSPVIELKELPQAM